MSTYLDLKNQFLRRKMLFEDPKFPADESSIFYKNEELAENIKWLRPQEVSGGHWTGNDVVALKPPSVSVTGPLHRYLFSSPWYLLKLSDHSPTTFQYF